MSTSETRTLFPAFGLPDVSAALPVVDEWSRSTDVVLQTALAVQEVAVETGVAWLEGAAQTNRQVLETAAEASRQTQQVALDTFNTLVSQGDRLSRSAA